MAGGLLLFIREHVAYVIFQIFVVAFILLLYWLEGFRNVETAAYSIIMSVVLVVTFLTVRYMLRRRYLQKISDLPKSMEMALQKDAKTAEHVLTEKYMQHLYKHYQHEVQQLYASQTRQYKFMNQWIHQMKTPLSVLELLLQEPEIDSRSMQEEVDRMKRGLDMVLMTARIENFQEDFQVEQVNLKGLVTSVINDNKRLFITNRVFPQVDIDESIIVMSDSKWLQFCVMQFITNAVKYTFEDGKKIYVRSSIEDGRVRLKIVDEGIGIPVSDLTRVTKPFYTGENGRKTGESTGMGLYLAQEILTKLGHELHIRSEVGLGTEVEVLFQ